MITLPRDDLKKQEILQKIARKFEKDKEYSEQEVNEIIKSFDVDDYTLIRRELVNFNYLGKDSYKGVYWLKKDTLSKEELEILQDKLKCLNIQSSLVKKPWGFGYRIRIGGENLQRFISMIYPYILPCFKYKTILFYKRKETALKLSSAEQYVVEYTTIEDIVRHPEKSGE